MLFKVLNSYETLNEPRQPGNANGMIFLILYH